MNHQPQPGLFGQAAQTAKLRSEASQGIELTRLISEASQIGDVIETGPDEFKVLAHDSKRGKVLGLPLRSFLLATRLSPGSSPSPKEEDSRLVLLRVMSAAPAASKDVEAIKMNAARRSWDKSTTWDNKEHLDKFSLNELRFDILTCRVVGSFEMRSAGEGSFELHFAYDIRDTYRGVGFKVYKPLGVELEGIVNYSKRRTEEDHVLKGQALDLGHLRYTSAGFDPDELSAENVKVTIDPTDLLARKSALFGMSRTGKSNTTKVIMQSVFALREADPAKGRVGMLVFDPNGEYANPNMQDGSRSADAARKSPTAIRDVWKTVRGGAQDDVLVYGWTAPKHDPERRLIKVNFYGRDPKNWKDPDQIRAALDPLVIGKEIIDAVLEDEPSKYIKAFRDTAINIDAALDDIGDLTRFKRTLLAYRSILAAAGYRIPAGLHADFTDLFNKEFIEAFASHAGEIANVLGQGEVTWARASAAMTELAKFVGDSKSSYSKYNRAYLAKKGYDYLDPTFLGIVGLLGHAGGIKVVLRPKAQHSETSEDDFANEIAQHVRGGKLVIVDQAIGDPVLVSKAADRIATALFNAQKGDFINPRYDDAGNPLSPPDVLIFVEEAHNILPNNAADVSNVWSRIAKEGAKFRIGMLLATQEPSLIQRYILSNCDNWFLGYLFSSKEIATLSEYGDFADFAGHIGRAADPGLLVVRTLSNPYSVPVQIRRFALKVEG